MVVGFDLWFVFWLLVCLGGLLAKCSWCFGWFGSTFAELGGIRLFGLRWLYVNSVDLALFFLLFGGVVFGGFVVLMSLRVVVIVVFLSVFFVGFLFADLLCLRCVWLVFMIGLFAWSVVVCIWLFDAEFVVRFGSCLLIVDVAV